MGSEEEQGGEREGERWVGVGWGEGERWVGVGWGGEREGER